MTRTPFTTVAELEAFLVGIIDAPSDEPGLGELEHALQCGEILRARAPDDIALQVAGLLHDIGAALGFTRDHGVAGAVALEPLLGARVAELVRLHVDAKRYLVTRDPAYRAGLSPVSSVSFEAQGGMMTRSEVDASWRALSALMRFDCARRTISPRSRADRPLDWRTGSRR